MAINDSTVELLVAVYGDVGTWLTQTEMSVEAATAALRVWDRANVLTATLQDDCHYRLQEYLKADPDKISSFLHHAPFAQELAKVIRRRGKCDRLCVVNGVPVMEHAGFSQAWEQVERLAQGSTLPVTCRRPWHPCPVAQRTCDDLYNFTDARLPLGIRCARLAYWLDGDQPFDFQERLEALLAANDGATSTRLPCLSIPANASSQTRAAARLPP